MSDLDCPHCGERLSDEKLLWPLIYFLDSWIADEYGYDRVCGTCYEALEERWEELGCPPSEMGKRIEKLWEKLEETYMRKYACPNPECQHVFYTLWHPVACPKCQAPM